MSQSTDGEGAVTPSKPGQLFGANSVEVSVIMKNGSNISK